MRFEVGVTSDEGRRRDPCHIERRTSAHCSRKELKIGAAKTAEVAPACDMIVDAHRTFMFDAQANKDIVEVPTLPSTRL